MPEGRFFEGAGDALFCGETLIAGYRIRSDVKSQQLIGALLRCEVIPLELGGLGGTGGFDQGDDDAFLIGVGIGQTRNQGDWAFSAAWTRVETDSVISMFTQSDYGRRGGTNVQGPIAKLDYMLLPRLTLTARGYFVNFIDRPKSLPNATVNRVQFDALFAF